MNSGQRVLAELRSVLGAHESPDGSNWGHPFIEAAHRLFNLPPNPWCAMAVGLAFQRAGISDSGLIHPYTGFICDRADAMGGLRPEPGKPAPPGSLVIRCGIHVELLEQDRGNGLLDDVGGNVGNEVKEVTRAADEWRIIVPPAIAADARPIVPLFRMTYGFDDLNLRPTLYGGWPSRDARRQQRLRFLESHPGWWARDVRVNRASPFAFEAGPQGSYGAKWKRGGWPEFDIREEELEAYAERVGHRNLRRWSKRVQVLPRTGGPSAEESLT